MNIKHMYWYCKIMSFFTVSPTEAGFISQNDCLTSNAVSISDKSLDSCNMKPDKQTAIQN